MLIATLIVVGLCLAAGTAMAAVGVQARPDKPDPQSLVAVGLLADRTAIAPGESARVGVHLQVAPGWHVLWKHPGDAGAATTVSFEGGDVGEVSYPAPVMLEAGTRQMYALPSEALLATTLQAPAGARQVELVAEVRYTVTDGSQALPGTQRVSLTLPVAADAGPSEHEARFDDHASHVPEPAGESELVSRVHVLPDGNTVVFEVTQKVLAAELFVVSPAKVSVFDRDVAVKGSQVVVKLGVRPYAAFDRRPTPMDLVLRLKTAEQAWTVSQRLLYDGTTLEQE
ncbi:MAG: protein-disulfide reductase DsbD domain-containing protein [Phycisphaerae bacterium]